MLQYIARNLMPTASPPAFTGCDRDIENLPLASQAVTDISTCWFLGSITDYDIHSEISSSLLKWLDRVSHFNAAEIALKAFSVNLHYIRHSWHHCTIYFEGIFLFAAESEFLNTKS